MTTQSQQVIVHVHTNVKNKNKDSKDCLKKDGKKKKTKRITVPPLGGDPKPFAKNPRYSRGKDVPYSSSQTIQQNIPSMHSGAFYSSNVPTVLPQFPQIRYDLEPKLYPTLPNVSRTTVEELPDDEQPLTKGEFKDASNRLVRYLQIKDSEEPQPKRSGLQFKEVRMAQPAPPQAEGEPAQPAPPRAEPVVRRGVRLAKQVDRGNILPSRLRRSTTANRYRMAGLVYDDESELE